MGLDDTASPEGLEDYRLAVRNWLVANMPRLSPGFSRMGQTKDRLRELMRRLWDGGYAGICFPTEVGGQGLSRAHHAVFCEEATGYELPFHVGNPGLSIIAPPILEFGTTEQKRHITAMLRGDEIFAQMMSEPSGGSDMAGARTRADRDGDSWILNGSKIWSSGAYRSDWGLVLVRTNWDVPKHRGLSMFLLDLSLPGITINNIRMVDGAVEFCQEYFDNVVVPAECLLGAPDDGWTVATRLLVHERDAVGGGSPYDFPFPRSQADVGGGDMAGLARQYGVASDPRVRELVGEARANDIVARELIIQVTDRIGAGELAPIAGSLLRLNVGVTNVRKMTIALEIAGNAAVSWDEGGVSSPGEQYILRQALCIGGGTVEMQRNLISERLLGMPREPAADRDKPFSEVRQSAGR